jgi:hypothetical protein
MRIPPVQAMAFPAWEPPGEQVMKRIVRLVPAPSKVTVRLRLSGSPATPADRLLARIRTAIHSRKERF